jgi:NAD(P)-dependent dehydrogenase (short-subunit alcohol dehydrogenase family)
MTALTGQVALVTGAARGIGRAVTTALSAAGATVVPLDVDDAVTELPHAVVADLQDEDALRGAVARLVREHGGWHILVNNAGVGRHNPVSEIATADLDLMWAVNVRATVLLTREAFRVMSGSGGGQILNVVSTAGLRGEPGESAYCATKAAVRGFTEGAAEEGRLHGIRVHGLYPAGVDTGFWSDATVDGPGVDTSAVFLTAQDVAAAVVGALLQPPHVHLPEVVVRALRDADTARIAAKLERFRSTSAASDVSKEQVR